MSDFRKAPDYNQALAQIGSLIRPLPISYPRDRGGDRNIGMELRLDVNTRDATTPGLALIVCGACQLNRQCTGLIEIDHSYHLRDLQNDETRLEGYIVFPNSPEFGSTIMFDPDSSKFKRVPTVDGRRLREESPNRDMNLGTSLCSPRQPIRR